MTPGRKDDKQNGDQMIDIGGIEISRNVLAEALPDLRRFERHLPDALEVDKVMSENDGRIPACVDDWPRERIEAVVATLKEVGHLREQARSEIRDSDSHAGGADRSVPSFRHLNG